MRRSITTLLIAVAVTTTIGLASTAFAATVSVTNAECTSGSITRSALNGAPGDVIDITANLTGCSTVFVSKLLIDAPTQADAQTMVTVNGVTGAGMTGVIDVLDRTNDWSFVPRSGSITGLQITLGATLGTYSPGVTLNGSGPNNTTWNATISTNGGGGGGGSSSDSASSSAPAPLFQQFGKPSFGTCDAVAPESLNWSGVASGGWGESWAQWMNGGNGGAVCTRTLIYSTNESKWIVG